MSKEESTQPTTEDLGHESTGFQSLDDQAVKSEPMPPELTLRSGMAATGAALSYFTTVGFLNAFGIFQQYYSSLYLRNNTDFQIAWLGSFGTFSVFAAAAPAGLLADKYGPQIPMAAGSVMLIFAIFMTSLCREYYQFFLAQGLTVGVSMAFIAIPASGVVPRYFTKYRGLANGVTIAGSSLGGVVWPIAFNQLLHHDDVGFPWAMRIGGFIMIPLCTLAVIMTRPPLRPTSTAVHDAELQSPVTLTTEEEPEKTNTKPRKDLSVLRGAPYVLVLGFYLVSIVNGASLFGRILPGIIADRFGRFNIMAVALFLASLIAFLWTTATSVGSVVIWTMAYGFASGTILSSQVTCATMLVDKESAGAAIGVVMASGSLASLFGAPIAGELLKHGYIALSSFTGALLFTGGCFITASRFVQNRSLTARV